MSEATVSTGGQLRQVVDWSAAVWAGLVSGMVHLTLARILGIPAALFLRATAGMVLGTDVLIGEMSLLTFIVGLVIHLVLSVGFACLIAIVLHRWGLLVGILGGAAFGLALYWINFYTIFALFVGFSTLRGPQMAIVHVVFGAVSGGIYEALEIEEFVEVEA